MKTNEWTLKTVELCGRIAVLAELHKWGDIQDLINQHTLDAYKTGMTEAGKIAEKIAYDDNNYNRSPELSDMQGAAIISARDNKTTL